MWDYIIGKICNRLLTATRVGRYTEDFICNIYLVGVSLILANTSHALNRIPLLMQRSCHHPGAKTSVLTKLKLTPTR